MTDTLQMCASLAGDAPSQTAGRGAPDRAQARRPSPIAGAEEQPATAPALRPRSGAAPRLRRWSVAELLALAVPRRASGALAH